MGWRGRWGWITQGTSRSLGILNRGVSWLDLPVARRVLGRAGGRRTTGTEVAHQKGWEWEWRQGDRFESCLGRKMDRSL